jgi:putative transposase
MNKAIKFRIYPNKEQKILIGKTFGCVRFVYNKMLADRIEHYENTYDKLKVTPAQYKNEFPWLREVDSLALCNAQLNLDRAFSNFFRDKRIGFPKFKTKKSNRQCYTTNLVRGNIQLENGYLKLPKLKVVKIKQHRNIPEEYRLKSVTISRTPTGKYYAGLLYEYDYHIEPVVPETFIGLDYSMKELFIASDGTSAKYPQYYRQTQERLKKEQRKLSNCMKGSNNRNKQRIRVAKLHEKVANQRRDFLHKLSRQITNAVDAVCIEDLNMKNMSQTRMFSKSVHDNGFGKFVSMLEYKLKDQGKELIKVDKWFPSSKMCSNCGSMRESLSLDERVYHCENCGNILDRDLNASYNIREEGKRLLLQKQKHRTVGHTGIARLRCSH